MADTAVFTIQGSSVSNEVQYALSTSTDYRLNPYQEICIVDRIWYDILGYCIPHRREEVSSSSNRAHFTSDKYENVTPPNKSSIHQPPSCVLLGFFGPLANGYTTWCISIEGK